MSNFWLNTVKATILGRNRKSITIPAFAVRCGEDNRSLYFKLRTVEGGIFQGVTGDSTYGMRAAFTVEMWVKTWGTFSTGAVLFANHRSAEDDNNVAILLQDQKIGVAVIKSAATQVLTTLKPFPTNRWFHLAVSYNGSVIKIFVDGEQDSNTLSVAANLDGASAQEYDYVIGNNYETGAAYPFVGYLGEVRVWKSCLTPEQIKRNRFFRRGKNANLVKYYKTNFQTSGAGTFRELIDNGEFVLTGYAPVANLEQVSDEYPPLKYGASFIAAKYSVTVDAPITLKYPVSCPTDANFMLCVSYIGDDGRMVRYKLWDMDGVVIWPQPERYRGQSLPVSFFFEVWNIDGESHCTLEDDLVLYASKTSVPTSMIDTASSALVTSPTIDYTIFEILPSTFPADYVDNGFGTVASPVTQPVGTYSTNLTVWGGIQ